MQQSKMAVSGQPIKVFNNGNMPALVKYEVYFTGPVPLVPWTYFSPLGWNAKQIPPGVRDFTYVDDIVEGVTRVIDNPPVQSSLDARVSEGGTTEAASPPQHNATSGPHTNTTDAPYKVYNIGNSSPVQLMEYIGAIEQSLNKTAKKEFLPMQPGDVPKTQADVTDLVENLGYKPNTQVQKGIERFIE